MNIEEARMQVTETLGDDWRLASVDSVLVPGPAVGAPTLNRVIVTLDYHGSGRSEGDAWAVGPHVVFRGEGHDIESAIAVAVGRAWEHPYALPTGNVRR